MPETRAKKGRKRGKATRRGWRTAATSDRHDLYERAVQEPQSECDLIDQVWSELRGRRPTTIREDFCGTAAVAVEWVRRRRTNRSIGVDIDAEVLGWARSRISERLTGAQAGRLELLEADVLKVRSEPVDSVLAMNFSYFLLKTRSELRSYFRKVHRSLIDDGLFLLDAYGGSDSFLELEEDRDLDGFTYVWDQHHYNPITGRAVNHIHFRFPDGSQMRRAFTYDWRLWTLPEIRETLVEAGFDDALVYWEGTDARTGDGDGNWKQTEDGEACQGWIAYIVGVKGKATRRSKAAGKGKGKAKASKAESRK